MDKVYDALGNCDRRTLDALAEDIRILAINWECVGGWSVNNEGPADNAAAARVLHALADYITARNNSLQPYRCPNCETLNTPDDEFCTTCERVLDWVGGRYG